MDNFFTLIISQPVDYLILKITKWETLKLLITFGLIILSIQKASISLQLHSNKRQIHLRPNRIFIIKSNINKSGKANVHL